MTPEQQSYLQGLTMGIDVARHVRGLPVLSGSACAGVAQDPSTTRPQASNPDGLAFAAQERTLSGGKKLCKEEEAKRAKSPWEMWDEMRSNAEQERFPQGTDVFLYKYHGLFYVSPAQNSFMTRLRFPGGIVKAYQLRGLADMADRLAGGYADVTTRANLQLREIAAADALAVISGLEELGILNRGSGADNIRNVTASPLSGIDPTELIETYPLAREMHDYILHHRELYGLPRKFNIAFDGGGAIASLDDTNDIGFRAVCVPENAATSDVPAGICFQLTLGGITGHQDFARDTGILLTPRETIPAAAALVRVFIEHGDRTDRKRARLKYLLDDWGFDRFLAEAAKHLPFTWRRFDVSRCAPRPPEDRLAHVGVHPQKQSGKHYVGVVLPVGRLTSEQMRRIAALAERYGRGEVRLTVWQNLLVPHIDAADLAPVQAELVAMGLDWQATNIRAGLVACTGNAGCKYAAANTKRQGTLLAKHLERRLELDTPLNIHITGCQHSCAQHYIGDIGLIATKVPQGEEMVEGFHVFVGGGWNNRQAIGRELATAVPCDDVPPLLERLLRGYLHQRLSAQETFAEFARRQDVDALRQLACGADLQPEPLPV